MEHNNAEEIQRIASAVKTVGHINRQIVGANIYKEILSLSDPLKQSMFTSQSNYYPNNQSLGRVYEIMRNAVEFYNAGRGNWTTWDYQDGNNPFKLKVTNGSGDGIVDCSGFTGMVMRGWGFFDSVYGSKRGQANATCTPSETHESTGSRYQWDWDYQFHGEQLTYGSDASLKFSNYWRVITAADQAAYFASQGRLYPASGFSPRIGDLCFFEKPGGNGRFLNISHVGFMLSPNYYLNATETNTTEGVIVTRNAARPPQYYARPNYFDWNVFQPSGIPSSLNLMPRAYYNLGPSGSANGLTHYCAADGTITFSGVNTAKHRHGWLVSAYCPLVLPKGTYRLSGFNCGGSHVTGVWEYFGMRVYAASITTTQSVTPAGITGTTWSPDGSKSENKSPVWDIGGGCEFTLSEETAICIDLYCGDPGASYNNISCKPVLTKIA